MKYAVIGSRNPSNESVIKVWEYLNEFICELDDDVEIVTGGAFGMDTEGMKFAHEHAIPLTVYEPAGWHNEELCDEYRGDENNNIVHTGLGFNERNTLIINDADVVIVGDFGNGTIDAMNKAIAQHKPVYVFGHYIPGRYVKRIPEGIIYMG